MEWLDAFILGLVQGLAEYLPVSSSGHLQIFREILGIDLPNDISLQFDIILHAATVLSTIVVLWPLFRKLFVSVFSFRRDADFWYVCKILISCIPIAFVGFAFKDYIEEAFNNLLVVGICLCFTAALLCFAHFSDRTRGGQMVSPEKGRDISWWDAFIMGCAQALAVLPGLSRSGLFAKIKSLADITPNEMIQMVRLKKAAQLLQEKKYTVSEISYMVGFSSPSYFSKCFQKQFGIKPADY